MSRLPAAPRIRVAGRQACTATGLVRSGLQRALSSRERELLARRQRPFRSPSPNAGASNSAIQPSARFAHNRPSGCPHSLANPLHALASTPPLLQPCPSRSPMKTSRECGNWHWIARWARWTLTAWQSGSGDRQQMLQGYPAISIKVTAGRVGWPREQRAVVQREPRLSTVLIKRAD